MRDYTIEINFAIFDDVSMTDEGRRQMRNDVARIVTKELRKHKKYEEVDGIDERHGRGEITIYVRRA